MLKLYRFLSYIVCLLLLSQVLEIFVPVAFSDLYIDNNAIAVALSYLFFSICIFSFTYQTSKNKSKKNQYYEIIDSAETTKEKKIKHYVFLSIFNLLFAILILFISVLILHDYFIDVNSDKLWNVEIDGFYRITFGLIIILFGFLQIYYIYKIYRQYKKSKII